MVNTSKLQQYSTDLKSWNKYTDALFIDNLINEINKRPSACINAVKQWLKSAFQDLPKDPINDNCIHSYNRSLYHQILQLLNN